MTQRAPVLQNLAPAALGSVQAIDDCHPVLAKMELPNDERTNVAIALLHAWLEQARSTCVLVAHDIHPGLFRALILLRSLVD